MSLSLSELKKLHDKGLALIYLREKSKRPFETGWTTQAPKKWEELENSFERSYNLGVRLGEPSKLPSGNYLAAIDCDVKSKSRKALREMNDALRGLGIDLDSAPIVMSGRGNGSKHVYVQTRVPLKPQKFAQSKIKVKVLMPGEKKPYTEKEKAQLTQAEQDQGYRIRPAWEIALMGTGQQTVLPPSIHPDTGWAYKWASPFTVKQMPVFKVLERQEMKALHTASDTSSFKAETVDLYSSELSLNWISTIEEGAPRGSRSEVLLGVSMAMCRAGFTDNQILSVLSDPNHGISEAVYERRNGRASAVQWLTQYALTKARHETNIMRKFENKPEMKPLGKKEVKKINQELEDERHWQQELQKNEKKGYKNNLNNVELILSNVVGEKVFVHDQFSTRDSYGMDTAWGGKKAQNLGDIDLIKIRRWLSSTSFKIEPGKDLVLDAVKFIADRNKVHPVREWLKSLEWDGVSRIDTWIRDYLKGEAEEPYLSEVSRTFLLAMVARVYQPGCQWDYTLVLEGAQGTYKSSTARALAGDEWFMDNLPDLRDKDVMLNLQGKWVIELGELADVKRGDYNLVKAYLNRRVDRVRSPYDKLPQDTPRQSVFIGTVNEGEYLKDPTGNRRFWPVKVGMCDVDGLKRARDQLFAEAVWIYENCFDGKLMLGKEATAQATAAQDDRRINDDSTEMEEALHAFISSEAKKPESKRFDFTRFKLKTLFQSFGPWMEWEGKTYCVQLGAQVLHRVGAEKRKIKGQRLWRLGDEKGGTPFLQKNGKY